MKKTDPNKYPRGLDRRKVQAIIAHYDNQTEDEAIAEMDEGLAIKAGTTIIRIDTGVSRQITDLAREKKTTVGKLIESWIKQNLRRLKTA